MTSVESEAIYVSQDLLSKQNVMPLEIFRQILQYHPYHFWGLSNQLVPVSSACNDIVHEYSYQHADRIGRTEIRDAIATAERMIVPYMGFAPYPHYVEEIVEFPYVDKSMLPLYNHVSTREGKLISMGVKTLDLIVSDATPVFTSEYNRNGLIDTFTITLLPAQVYEEDEIEIYVGEDYRVRKFDNVGDYKIELVDVDIDSVTGLITISGSIWLLVKPELYEDITSESIDPSEVTNFVDKIDVYRRYTSSGASYSSAECILVWDDNPEINGAYVNSSTGITYAYGKLGIRNAEQGSVSVGEAVWNTETSKWEANSYWLSGCRNPDRAIIRYYAGAPMTSDYFGMICRLAAAELTRPICACDSANKWLYHWQFDLSRMGAQDEAFNLPQNLLGNPFGQRRGHVNAWQTIMGKKNLRGFAI